MSMAHNGFNFWLMHMDQVVHDKKVSGNKTESGHSKQVIGLAQNEKFGPPLKTQKRRQMSVVLRKTWYEPKYRKCLASITRIIDCGDQILRQARKCFMSRKQSDDLI